MLRYRRGTRFVIAFLFYLLAAMAVTWPLILEAGHSLPGPSTDSYVHYWNGWWVREALQLGQSPYYTQQIFYPQGVSLVTHNLAWLSITPWLLLQLFLPDLVAYNVVLLLNLALCGFAAYLLVRTLTKNEMAALVAGLIYLAWPFRITQLDHPNLISTYWLPLALLFIICWIREGRWRHAVAAGVALALVGYTRWQMLIPAAFVTGVLLLGMQRSWLRSGRKWGGLVLTAALALFLLIPPILLLAQEWQSTVSSGSDLLREGEEAVMQTDLLAYVTPGSNHPVWGEFFESRYDRYYADRSPSRRFRAYIGLATLLLVGIGLWRRKRDAVPWLLAALTLMALAMGSVLRVNGQLYPEIPTLYGLLEPFYLVRLMRVPDRFNVTLALPVAVMAGYGLMVLLGRVGRRGTLVSVGLGALILFEYLAVPVPLLEGRAAPAYQLLAQDATPGAVLNLPMDQQQAKRYMLAQTVHGRPLVQGKVARIPPGSYDYIEGHPWLLALHQFNEMAPWLTDVSAQLGMLHEDGIEYLILDRQDSRYRRWQRYLVMEPVHEDEELAVFTTHPRAGENFYLWRELAPGIGPVRAQLADDCVRAGDVIGVDGAWGTTHATEEAYTVSLILRNAIGAVVQETRLVDALPADEADSLRWTYLALETDAGLEAGDYRVALALTGAGDAGTENNDAIWPVGTVTVQESACEHEDLPEGAQTTDANFGNDMRLLGYETQREGEQLTVTLYWRMMQHMDIDYKVFIHVFDRQTGIPVAQDDSMPLRDRYPTRFWAAGETVVDRIEIPLPAGTIAPGTYGLAVGVYDPNTLERAVLRDGNGTLIEDGRLVLRGEQVTIERGE